MVPRSKSREGALYAYRNAQHLYKVASRMRAPSSAGLATSLFILSSEESAKSVALFKHAEGIEDADVLPKVFRRHSAKHEITTNVSTVLHGLLTTTGHHAVGCNLLDHLATWPSRADEIKQRGLYVDYSEGEWKFPHDISLEDHALAKLVCKTLLATAKSLSIDAA